jgi:hypothetical protein
MVRHHHCPFHQCNSLLYTTPSSLILAGTIDY